MTMTVYPVPALRDNYIWMLVDEQAGCAFAVDPGAAKPVVAFLSEKNLFLAGVLLTHHHADHSGGISELQRQFPGLAVYGSPLSPLSILTERKGEGDVIDCGFASFTVLAVPGHTLDHQVYYGGGMLFSGDTLFSAGCGRIFEGTVSLMFASLQKLLGLPSETKMYCGHEYTEANLKFAAVVEPDNSFVSDRLREIAADKSGSVCTLPSTLGEERQFNPFLRCGESAVVHAAQRHAGRSLQDAVSVFGVLREWKNIF